MDFSSGMLAAIGNTPAVKLDRLFGRSGIHVFAKMELANPGGSAKDRPALRMIRAAREEGRIGPGSVIVESSSGNMAISLAMICRSLGMRFVSVIDPRTTEHHIKLLRAWGADIEWVADPDPETGEFLPARLNRVQRLLAERPGSFWPNQYENANNYLSHCDTTMKEIVEQVGAPDYLFCGVSTCGTIRGCARYARDRGLNVRIVAVDAEGSSIFRPAEGKRRFPGLGAGIVPPMHDPSLIDRVVHVSDRDIVAGCRALVREEGIMAGASSGGVIAAVRALLPELPSGSVCAVILHDRGERYIDTVYSDEWVESEFGRGAECCT